MYNINIFWYTGTREVLLIPKVEVSQSLVRDKFSDQICFLFVKFLHL